VGYPTELALGASKTIKLKLNHNLKKVVYRLKGKKVMRPTKFADINRK
jgi:hypothetical protein